MCGACGAPAAGWTERIAPLDPRGARRRARALTTLVAGTSSAPRTVVAPLPGGGWRITRAGGWDYAPTLLEATAVLTRRLGPLVPLGSGDTSTSASVAGGVGADAVAVWCAALAVSGLLDEGHVELVYGGTAVDLATGGVTVACAGSEGSDTLTAPRSAIRLARSLAALA